MKNWLGWIVVALCLVPLDLCWGQTDTARLQGTVVDTSGSSVAGATVTVRNLETNRVYIVESNGADGGFSIPALPVGRYKIEVSKIGFKTVTR